MATKLVTICKVSTVPEGLETLLDEICALLGYYAALSGSSVPSFRGSLTVKKFLTIANGTDRLSRNVGTELPLNAAL